MNSLGRNSYSTWIFPVLLLFACTKRQYTAKVLEQKQYPLSHGQAIDSAIFNFYKPYKLHIDSQMNVVIGIAASEIKRSQPEGKLNNLFADAMAATARKKAIAFDFVHVNYKSLRVPIPRGEIKINKIFELMPFENLMVTVKMTGLQVKELFNYMASQGGDPVSGASFRISEKGAEDILINGKPLNPASVYRVLTSDYVANGGDGARIYVTATDRIEYPLKVRDAILAYIREETAAGRQIEPSVEGRVKK